MSTSASTRPEKQSRLGETPAPTEENAAESTCTATWSKSKMMVFPKNLPWNMSTSSDLDCYPKLYKVVQKLLSHSTTEVVTVTVTPGAS
ncbi:hypothetical protein ON010_g3750 [Phytophthora cinnamomi]|nr:hypothetical protein ON010_g3750 [Phytophthora cinnamomi]